MYVSYRIFQKGRLLEKPPFRKRDPVSQFYGKKGARECAMSYLKYPCLSSNFWYYKLLYHWRIRMPLSHPFCWLALTFLHVQCDSQYWAEVLVFIRSSRRLLPSSSLQWGNTVAGDWDDGKIRAKNWKEVKQKPRNATFGTIFRAFCPVCVSQAPKISPLYHLADVMRSIEDWFLPV